MRNEIQDPIAVAAGFGRDDRAGIGELVFQPRSWHQPERRLGTEPNTRSSQARKATPLRSEGSGFPNGCRRCQAGGADRTTAFAKRHAKRRDGSPDPLIAARAL